MLFVLSGKNRIKVYVSLLNGIKTATDIKYDIKSPLSSICRTLKQMERVGIIMCLNKHSHRDKYYKITDPAIKFQDIVLNKFNSLQERLKQ